MADREQNRIARAVGHLDWILKALPFLGVLYYLGIRWAYSDFYNEFFITPETVGLGYLEMLAVSALPFLAVVASLGVLILLVGSLLFVLLPTRRPELLKWTVPVALLLLSVTLALSVVAFHGRAQGQAADVKEGGLVTTLGLGFLGIEASPACVYWTDSPEENPMNIEIDGRDVVYFGESEGRFVLFDHLFQRTMLISSDDVSVTLGFVCADSHLTR